ncbi:hypothetical protein AN958_11239 [Leucoagaricus sp. SymC.cos]|nr:hypothetical protein AN958_11239 [Leucoagaricus sp. SymC.cos]
MSILPGAQNFAIQGHNEFISVQNTHLNTRTGPSGIDILLEASYPDAAVDAEAREYVPKCFPGTREQYIHDIMHWATASDTEGLLPIFWMRGPAGVGKSAIAQTCAEKMKKLGQLGAAFFFSINGRNDRRRFFPTLAYQLSTAFSEFREILDDKVYRDKTLVRKTMASQFTSLIVEPLQELERRGKGIGRMAIVIDGLDECQGNNAQSEIIELIAASVREKRTPFRWAIFSRPEVHIKSTFDLENISPLCQRTLLPISREADGEIEHYLKGGFKNILRRRDLLSLSDSWPTKRDMEKLVEASAGLFAYPAAVLRFVDHHSFLGYKETLQVILEVITSCDKHSSRPVSPFAELDAFYILIMERIPKDMLSAVQLVLTYMFVGGDIGVGHGWYFATTCNVLRLSETSLRGICQQLHTVLEYQDAPKQLDLGEGTDTTRSFFEQGIPSSQRAQLRARLRGASGVVRLHHKSFYDFLIDPTRSLTFCVRTPVALEKIFNHFVKRHQQLAQSFLICSAGGLAHKSTVINRSLTLSSGPTGYTLEASQPSVLEYLPQDNELVRSFLQLDTFINTTCDLAHDSHTLPLFLESLPSDCLSKLAAYDHRKHLIADILMCGIGIFEENARVLDLWGVERLLPGMLFSCIDLDEFEFFDSRAFLAMVQKLEKLGVIKPYHPNLPSTLASIPLMFSRLKHAKCSGRYKLGHSDKAVYWYWEFDIEEGYFHEFRALDFAKAMRIYEKEKFAMWDEDWVAPL